MVGYLDWIKLSVDSLDPSTNAMIGRSTRINPDYHQLASRIKFYGYKFGVNTVVNRYNESENMNEFLNFYKPDRWKVFNTLRVDGQNDKLFDIIKPNPGGWEYFREIHKNQPNAVFEDNCDMISSYMLIDPLGRFFENTAGYHTYSDSLINYPVEHCLDQIKLNRDTFLGRGGIYAWK